MSTLQRVVPLFAFAFFAIPLSVIDARRHILPNRLVLAGCAIILVAELMLCEITHHWQLLCYSVAIASKTLMVYICLLVASRGQLGMGDVKYSFLTGLTIGWVAPNMWLASIWLAFTSAGLWVLLTLTRDKLKRHSAIAFGPFMSISVMSCALLGMSHF
jgi:leader peptidase (prepilin peptidase) / N-methyltransferase